MAAKTLTVKDLIAGFKVGHMTIFNWRQGTATKDPLPVDVDESGRVSAKPALVKAWAKKHSLTFTVPAEVGVTTKPGPKPKVAAKKTSNITT